MQKRKQIVIVLPNRLIYSLMVYYKRSILSGIRHRLTAFGFMRLLLSIWSVRIWS